MRASDDFVWPPPQSEIDAFELVDLESGKSHFPGADAHREEPTTVIRRSRSPLTAPDFTWPPVEDPHQAIVPLDVTLDGGSPWVRSDDLDTLGDAETLIAPHPQRFWGRDSRRPAAPSWMRWAAAVLLFAGGGVLL